MRKLQGSLLSPSEGWGTANAPPRQPRRIVIRFFPNIKEKLTNMSLDGTELNLLSFSCPA